MSDEKILENVMESFSSKIESQQLEIHNTEVPLGKTLIHALLFKSELSEAASSSILAHMKTVQIP